MVIKDSVFLVNGQPVKVKGVNRHESHPETGHYVTPVSYTHLNAPTPLSPRYFINVWFPTNMSVASVASVSKAEDLRDIQKPIGISDYELGHALPKDFRGSLPTIEEIEKELASEMCIRDRTWTKPPP